MVLNVSDPPVAIVPLPLESKSKVLEKLEFPE
jgi:hypothetical protein